jgi:hypothetical protein
MINYLRWSTLLTTALAMTSTVVAQPAALPTPTIAASQLPSSARSSGVNEQTSNMDPKSPQEARRRALIGTAVGPLLLVAAKVAASAGSIEASLGLGLAGFGAIAAGPSAGHWYAGESNLGMIALRTVGVTTAFVGLAMAHCGSGECDPVGSAVAFSGFAVVAGTTIYDVVTAGDAVRRYNRKSHSLSIAPTLLRNGTDSRVGFSLSGKF